MVRVCPHCDVRLDNVRCVRCYSLQAPGAFDCVRCGHALDLEPVLDATDAPCPRCRSPLEVSAAGAWERADPPFAGGDARLHECPRCGGMFVPRDALAEILARAEVQGAIPETRGVPALETVTYIPCPMCHTSMNRVNFGKLSGVIVDVCRSHGTWFDAGELTRVVAFAASGGLVKTRARELAEKRELEARRSSAHADAIVSLERHDMETRAEAWSDFLHTIFFW
jgi:Zn-finger nucleic acid-binding protein